jgi:hypothetical protein
MSLSAVTRLSAASLAAAVALSIAGCAEKSATGSGSGAKPAVAGAPAHVPQDFSCEGVFVEACTCHAPCACQLTGLEMGCLGVGAMGLSAGRYMGQDLAGVKVAYAGAPGEWVRLYVDCRPEQAKAAEAFARAAFAGLGPCESCATATIAIDGKAGTYTVTVNDGRTMKYSTVPTLGGDGRNPLCYSNIHDPIHSTVYQGTSTSCTFSDGPRRFTVPKGRNAYFTDSVKANGKI